MTVTHHRAVGVLGVGQMGAGIVQTLRRAGWDVSIAPRHPARARSLAASGAIRVQRPAEMAGRVDAVITSLPDVAAVRDVLLGDHGLLSVGPWPGLIIETSTIAPRDARTLHDELAALGVAMVDAPVSGGAQGARSGNLSIMVGGHEAPFARAMPVLEVIGSRVVHCGGPGSGQVAKACNQLIVMSTLAAVAESLSLAEHAGVDPRAVREAMLGGFAASPILEAHGRRMLEGEFRPGGKASFHRKDIAAIESIQEGSALSLPVFGAVRQRFEELLGLPGGGDLDHAAIIRCYPRPARRARQIAAGRAAGMRGPSRG
jgi:2-hydroxy-3-oxopropionate reductase